MGISHFFFANDITCCLFCAYFRLWKLEKKQIRTVFLFEFKVGHKTTETTCKLSNAFGPETANKHTVQWWFKTFCKGDKSLDEDHSGWPSEVDNDQLRAIIEADPFTTT